MTSTKTCPAAKTQSSVPHMSIGSSTTSVRLAAEPGVTVTFCSNPQDASLESPLLYDTENGNTRISFAAH